MLFACWITKATGTHSEHVILLFHSNDGYANAPERYVYAYIACLFSVVSVFCVALFLFSCPYFSFRSRDNIYCLDMGCQSVVQYPAWSKRCFLFHNGQTGSGAHSTFFLPPPMDAGYSFRGCINRLAPESEHSPLSSADFKNQWFCISAPLVRLYDVQRNNFVSTFTFSLLTSLVV